MITPIRRRLSCLSAITGFLGLCLQPCAAEQSSLDADPLPGSWGINVHNLFHAPALKAIGAQWVRINLSWSSVEHNSKNNYDWDKADKEVNHYLTNHLHIICILNVEQLNPLYSNDVSNRQTVLSGISHWMGAVAQHFKENGIVWEISNEPDISSMGGYWNNPVTYSQMARQSALAIRQADPTAKTAALSLAWMDRGFASAVLDQGLLADGTINYLSFHGYHRKTIEPESGLAEDVAWLRSAAAMATPAGTNVPEIIDSETGYSLAPFETPKDIGSWRVAVYSEAAQASYLARHFIEEIYLGLPISIWYKDMNGEKGFSLYYSDETGAKGLRPMGKVFSALATLLPESPANLRNDKYTVALQLVGQPHLSLASSVSQPQPLVRSFLRTSPSGKRQLIVAVWNAVEAFDGKILVSRTFTKTTVLETWRDATPNDPVKVAVVVNIAGLDAATIRSVDLVPLLDSQPSGPIKQTDMHSHPSGPAVSLNIEAGPLPTVVAISLGGR